MDKRVFITGVSGSGKTSFLKYANKNLKDFDVIFAQDDVKSKIFNRYNDPEQTLLTCCSRHEEIYKKSSTSNWLLIDGVDFDVIIEEAITKELCEENSGMDYLMELEEWFCKIFDQQQIIVLIPQYDLFRTISKHSLVQGKKFISEDLLNVQQKLFTYLCAKIKNLKCIQLTNELEYLSENYFQFINNSILEIININILPYYLVNDSNDIECHANSILKPSYIFDAGINLTSTEDYVCSKLSPVQILLKEKIIIPQGAYASIEARSSSLAYGIVQRGIIDSYYTGDLKVTFIPFENCLILKDQSICQLLFHKIPSLNIISHSGVDDFNEKCKEVLSKNLRGNHGFGSSDKNLKSIIHFNVDMNNTNSKENFIESIMDKWCGQPQGEEELKLYNTEMYIVDMLSK